MKLRKQRTQKTDISLDEGLLADGDALALEIPDRSPNPEQLCWASELRDLLVRTIEELRPSRILAKSLAGAQVVANQVAVVPSGVEKEAKAVNSDLDKGIEKNLDAALIQNRMHDNVKYDVKSGVLTLTGEVNSQAKRDHAEKVAASVPNVKQVV